MLVPLDDGGAQVRRDGAGGAADVQGLAGGVERGAKRVPRRRRPARRARTAGRGSAQDRGLQPLPGGFQAGRILRSRGRPRRRGYRRCRGAAGGPAGRSRVVVHGRPVRLAAAAVRAGPACGRRCGRGRGCQEQVVSWSRTAQSIWPVTIGVRSRHRRRPRRRRRSGTPIRAGGGGAGRGPARSRHGGAGRRAGRAGHVTVRCGGLAVPAGDQLPGDQPQAGLLDRIMPALRQRCGYLPARLSAPGRPAPP